MAAGISEALLTTQAGLVLAIPILFFYTVLTHFVDAITKHLRFVGGAIVHLSRRNSTDV